MNPLYVHEEVIHNLTAPREVVPIIMSMTNPKSVLDVGCGTGTWLKIFEENGISDYVGVDGDYVDRGLMKIPLTHFVAQDLRRKWSSNREFDLAISLEVAEHLPEESADDFVNALTAHSDTIIFSAAVPGQGGQNHLNEQWPQYWQQKFQACGYSFHDVLRPLIWTNPNVEWWYKQNIFLVKKGAPSKPTILDVIHPDLFAEKEHLKSKYLESILSGKGGLSIGVRICLNAIRQKLIRFVPVQKK